MLLSSSYPYDRQALRIIFTVTKDTNSNNRDPKIVSTRNDGGWAVTYTIYRDCRVSDDKRIKEFVMKFILLLVVSI